ncbi:hypothetical protein [Granulicella sibirica]|uniref:hypothetical protein n=1 Tax=Granulicella sibirica TaxID=2479048 RepID=UPI001008AEF6|nr:hypothetical protein [Granulicella sibirica]
MLTDECSSLTLAALLMYNELLKVRQSHVCDDAPDMNCVELTVAADYSGHHRHSSATIDYGPVLVAMMNIIKDYEGVFVDEGADHVPPTSSPP